MKTLPILAAAIAGLCLTACDTLIVDRGPVVERRGYVRNDRHYDRDYDRYDRGYDRRRSADRVYVQPTRSRTVYRDTTYVAPERRVYRQSTYVAPERRVYRSGTRSSVDINVNRY
ncbi:MAG TPA: hypothetical protein VF593_01920 [Chthoniobacteraceae bacterium]|jgi:hypothetical protein